MKFKGNWYEKGDEVVYLIKVEYKNETLLKIGYTSDIDSRIKSYESHNPNFMLLDLREGTKSLEDLMHRYFNKYRHLPSKEWFYYSDEIVNKFHLVNNGCFLDKDLLKRNIEKFFKHIPIKDLKEIYLENYKLEIENEKVEEKVLNRIMIYMFDQLNSYINLYFNHLDYSKIFSELDLETEYIFLLPNPFYPDKYIEISLDQLFNNPILNNKKSKEIIKIELENKEVFSITSLFNEYQRSKMDKTIKSIDYLKRFKGKLFSDVYKNEKYYKHDYVSIGLINGSEELIINKSIIKLEQWAFEIMKKFGFKIDLS
jgi:hypothetical protein